MERLSYGSPKSYFVKNCSDTRPGFLGCICSLRNSSQRRASAPHGVPLELPLIEQMQEADSAFFPAAAQDAAGIASF